MLRWPHAPVRRARAEGRDLKLVYYVSGHGFGHATRAAVLCEALKARRPGLNIEVRTAAPARLFSQRAAFVTRPPREIDPGLIQLNGLDIDYAASLAAAEKFLAGWEEAADAESRHLRESGAAFVLGDVPPLAFEAAARAGVPSAAVSNFSWDWVLADYAAAEPRWRPIAERYAAAYARAGELFALPMTAPMPAFAKLTRTPLVARPSAADPRQTRRALQLPPDEERPVVFVSFGGFGPGEMDLRRSEDLSDVRFVGFGAKPRGLKAEWTDLPRAGKLPHVDVMAACDALLGKPGYGTFSEALAQGKRILYLPRVGFAETPFLVTFIESVGTARVLPRDDFFAGRWRGALEALLEQPLKPPVPATGADFIAERLASRLG